MKSECVLSSIIITDMYRNFVLLTKNKTLVHCNIYKERRIVHNLFIVAEEDRAFKSTRMIVASK